jgi:signal transduction histidine kinase/ActR/RegA family two-component response regulator
MLRQLGGVVAAALLSIGALGYFITRSITRPLQAAVSAAQALSDDAMTRPMQVDDGDEIAQLALALDQVSIHRGRNVSISKMSHELRTPLNAILGFAEVLLTDRRRPLAATHRPHVERILRSGTHLVRLVDDLLDLSRIAAGFMVLKSEAVDALDLAQATVHELAALAAPQRIRVAVTAPGGPIGRVRADRTRLAQVLTNLVSNAIKYNRPGGRVRVDLRVVGDRARLVVHDTGIGLSRDQREGLFRPFDRLGRETTGVQGTGLGLVITRKLIQLMEGTLEVESTPGVGSRFIVGLALAPAQDGDAGDPRQRRPGPGASAPADRLAGSVVCVDDDETNRALMQAYLSRRPRVRLAMVSDGALALAAAARERADLMLIDIMMPGMDGFAILRELRRHPQLQATRCVAVSANAMPADVERAIAAGFDGYLTKPLSIALLLAEVDKWLPGADDADADADEGEGPGTG